MQVDFKKVHLALGAAAISGAVGMLIEPRLVWLSVIALGGWVTLGVLYIHRSVAATLLLWGAATIAFPPAIVPGIIAVIAVLLFKHVFGVFDRVNDVIESNSGGLESAGAARDAFGNDFARPDYIWGVHSRNAGMGHILSDDDSF